MSRVSVPGNLLITGEYVITEEGGRGLACAIAPRVHGWIEDAPGFQVKGWTGTQAVEWSPRPDTPAASQSESSSSGLLDRIVPFLLDHAHTAPRGRMVIDSSAFFSARGHKLGFGSSAAVTVALTALISGGPELASGELVDLAVQAHRHAQGGRGSGYDVVTSLLGGVGVFTGGARPFWTAADGWWLDGAALFPGSAHTDTVQAVQRHREWREAHPADWKRLRSDSEAATHRLVRAGTWPEVASAVDHARRVGEEIGRAISVPACIDGAATQLPDERAGDRRNDAGQEGAGESDLLPVCKSVGAGAELALCIGLRNGVEELRALEASGARRLELEEEGLRWE